MRWLIALLAVLSLFAAACSASEDDEETSTGDTTADTEAPSTDDTEAPSTDDTEAPTTDDTEAPMEEELVVDYGVTEDAIRVGLTADLSGVFSGLTTVIVDTYEAYFDRVN